VQYSLLKKKNKMKRCDLLWKFRLKSGPPKAKFPFPKYKKAVMHMGVSINHRRSRVDTLPYYVISVEVLQNVSKNSHPTTNMQIR
jgi:hypothetical protein